MNPVHIYFKEIDIDQDQSFTINFAKENEIENVLFDGQNEYSVSRMNIRPVLKDEKIIIVQNKKEQKEISEEVQELIRQNKEPNLAFIIWHPETNSLEIPFIKKMKQNYWKRNWLFLILLLKKMKILHFMTTFDIQKNSDINGVKQVLSTK